MKDIALVTYSGRLDLSASDQTLVVPLKQRGIQALPVVWDDPGVNWQRFDAIILRSCWDYHTRPQEFRQWIERLKQEGVSLYNTADTVLWNMEKTYLRTMTQHGVKTIPTLWATKDEPLALVDVLKTQDWSQAILKPTIGASADGIQVVSQADAEQSQKLFEALLTQGTVMIQPVIEQIREGELSLVFFRDAFSYAIRKLPGQGTVFVNSSYGGSYSRVDVPESLIIDAQQILHVARTLTSDTAFLYARVDGLVVEGEFVLMELELIEPGLFLDQASAQHFAAAIEEVMQGGS